MRRAALLTTLVTAVAVAVAGLAWGTGDGSRAAQPPAPAADVYFGWVLGTKTPTGIAVDADPAAEDGTRRIRVYVCDGLGPPRGKAVWFTGTIDVDRVNEVRRGLTLRSASRKEKLYVEHVDEHLFSGAFVDARGRRRQFAATPATGGAGIYQVTLDRDLRYSGTSTQGHALTAQAKRGGDVAGQITTTDGSTIEFNIHTLSFAPVADLKRSGFTRRHRRDRRRSMQPGEYVAVVAPGGSHWLGRSGNVRGGKAGNNIIGLDKAC